MEQHWFEKFGFVEDPYYLAEPWVTPFDKIVWNRDDLEETKNKVDSYINELKNGYNTSIIIWGPWRSGKSWLARYIQKSIHEQKGFYFITIIIEQGDPSLNAFFEQSMSKLTESNWINQISESIPESQKKENWKIYFKSEDLGQAFYNIYTGNEPRRSKEWLIGRKLTVTDMRAIDVQTNLDSLYKKMETLRTIIRISHNSFKNFILCVDQLEGAKGRDARLLSDLLREMIGSFYDRFGLILVLTIDTISQWYELGFTDALFQRVRYSVEMGLLKHDYIPKFLTKQNEVYRNKEWGGSKLSPFTRSTILHLAESMLPDKIYPRFLLFNCAILSKELAERGRKMVTISFIDSVLNRLDYILKKSGQLQLQNNIS